MMRALSALNTTYQHRSHDAVLAARLMQSAARVRGILATSTEDILAAVEAERAAQAELETAFAVAGDDADC